MLRTKQSLDSQKIKGLKKVWINNVFPEVDGGIFPAKYVVGDIVSVTADIFADGIDEITAILNYKHDSDLEWKRVDFVFLENDRWEAKFKVNKLGIYTFNLNAWTNNFQTWKKRFLKKLALDDDVDIEKKIGIELLQASCKDNAETFIANTMELFLAARKKSELKKIISNKQLDLWMKENLAPAFISEYHQLSIQVDPFYAQFSAWYELFPRSVTNEDKEHGTFQNVINYLPRIKKMGFDVLYFPPIHPIGQNNRKGKNNSTTALEGDPGSPWAIGSIEGGHKSIHPQLGTMNDFRKLIKKAKQLDIHIALDFAIQCSPDHPYLTNNPQWFKHRPDGTFQYAENPPKKYQDIYPLDFSSKEWPALWLELKSIVQFWVKEGVKIFRVDNPHTKPFVFWEWLINEIKTEYPEVIFLAEAFTRPKIMQHLAKCGFSQSYTYFTWRTSKEELTQYMYELNAIPMRQYFRPNFWANTPDILQEFLQKGGRPAFMIRFVLAATLTSNYGIYGPAYEHCVGTPLHEGFEEYLDSEKYAITYWDNTKENIIEFISLVNQIRQQHTALQNNVSLNFHPTDNPKILCYSKHNLKSSDIIVVVVNLDYEFKQSGFVTMNLNKLGIKNKQYKVHDLLTDQHYFWEHGKCYVALDPQQDQVAHLFHVKDEML